MISKYDVMSYSAMGAAFATFLAGLCYDAKQVGMAWALGLIAAGCIISLLIAYLHTPEKG